VDFFLAETGPNKLTVGKIFGGMLILENWKLTRFGTTASSTFKHLPVTIYNVLLDPEGKNRIFQSLSRMEERLF